MASMFASFVTRRTMHSCTVAAAGSGAPLAAALHVPTSTAHLHMHSSASALRRASPLLLASSTVPQPWLRSSTSTSSASASVPLFSQLTATHTNWRKRNFDKNGKPNFKLKTHSGSKRRFKVRANGDIQHWRAGRNHYAASQSRKQLDRKNRPKLISPSDYRAVVRSLPYLNRRRKKS